MYEVIYFSRSGNTRKMAAAIAGEVNVKARHIRSVKSLPEAEVLFLGSGLYLLRPSKLIRDFIRHNDFRGRKIALFGTSTTGIGIEIIGMERLLKRKGAIITGKHYCAGKFFFIRKGRPSDKDMTSAREFAHSIRSKFYSASAAIESEKASMENEHLRPAEISN